MAAAQVLGEQGDTSDVARLIKVASKDPQSQLASVAFNSALKIQSPEDAYNFLWQQGQPDQPLRELAFDKLLRDSGPIDYRAPSTATLLELLSENDAAGVEKMIARMPDVAGKEKAFSAALSLAKDSPEYQRTITLKVLRDEPQ